MDGAIGLELDLGGLPADRRGFGARHCVDEAEWPCECVKERRGSVESIAMSARNCVRRPGGEGMWAGHFSDVDADALR